ncbi:hypothetical protein F5Y03DRAFT_291875 [Xylaria venustula]|nr:hypothetical protein F5Y03DRAFT_291875 [Xylaria venustula]
MIETTVRMPTNDQITLFLWPEGLYPRRVGYWLLIKGLVSSPQDLLNGSTTDPNLSIVLQSPNITATSIEWNYNPENDPLPKNISTTTPCLRIRHSKTGNHRWVRESSSIIAYLEQVYADKAPSLQSKDLLDIAATNDLVGQINLSIFDAATYARHASPQLAAFAGLKEEERSRASARVGYQNMIKGLVKVSKWAEDSLRTTGWLTPGTNGPGLVDLNLAAPCRFYELAYGWNIFEKEELRPLAECYERFRKLSWWDALEERADVHPSELIFTLDDFKV